jgi:hypothetical protein
MINVNLLPKELIPKQRNLIPHLLIAGLAVVMFISYGTSLATKAVRINGGKENIAALESDIARLDDVVKQVERLEREKLVVFKKRQAVDQIMSGRTMWSHDLYTLASLVPEGVWLDQVGLGTRRRPVTEEVPNPNRKPGQPPTITKTVIKAFPALELKGYAVSPQREKGLNLVGEFLRNVKQDDVFSLRFIDPEMRSITRELYENHTVMKFVMDCEIVQ